MTHDRNRAGGNDSRTRSDKDIAPVDPEADRRAAVPRPDERPAAKDALEDQAHATEHPVGRVVGAAGGFAAGAVSGVAAGPVGSAVGAVAGAALGALSGGGDDGRHRERVDEQGRASAHASDALQAASPATYRFAFNFGEDAHERFGPGAKWDDVQPTLRHQWESERQRSLPTWSEVAQAVRDGWLERERSDD